MHIFAIYCVYLFSLNKIGAVGDEILRGEENAIDQRVNTYIPPKHNLGDIFILTHIKKKQSLENIVGKG